MSYHKHIELTNLHSPPSKQIHKLVEKAKTNNYYGVCLCSQDLRVAKKYSGEELKLITVIGFPPIHAYPLVNATKQNNIWLGLYGSKSFSYIYDIINTGLADELDVVFPFYMYYRKRYKRIEKFLKGIKTKFNKTVKVIVEAGTMITEPKSFKTICDILEQSNIDIVKTNTGLIPQSFSSLCKYVGIIKYTSDLKIKASGGIRTEEQVNRLLNMGVERIGTSNIKEPYGE